MGGDLAPNLGAPKKYFAAQFQEKFPFSGFLRIFPFFSHIFRMFTTLNVVYDHFLTRKTQFFTLFMLSRTSNNTTSQNIGGTNAWAVPPPQILGGPSPQSPLGLRPWCGMSSSMSWPFLPLNPLLGLFLSSLNYHFNLFQFLVMPGIFSHQRFQPLIVRRQFIDHSPEDDRR